MAAYLIGQILDVKDPAGFGEYREKVGATMERYGGKVRIAGGKVDVLEDGWQPALVVVEFKSAERAREWYDCEEYRPLKELRHGAADVQLIIVEGRLRPP
jgi:uncharacterized protein (DUF1330 family)